MPGQDQDALFIFLDYTAEANLLQKGTAQSFKSACRAVLSVLDDQEREDIFALDLDDVFRRFADTPHFPPLDPKTVYAYQQRTRTTIEGFRRYHADPVNWKPGSGRRRRRRAHTPPHTTQPVPDAVQPTDAETIVHHFPLRPTQFVQISGIPFDITKSEMGRLTNYLSHLVAVTDEHSQMPASLPIPESDPYVLPVPALPMPPADPAATDPEPVAEPTTEPASPASESDRVTNDPQEYGSDPR